MTPLPSSSVQSVHPDRAPPSHNPSLNPSNNVLPLLGQNISDQPRRLIPIQQLNSYTTPK